MKRMSNSRGKRDAALGRKNLIVFCLLLALGIGFPLLELHAEKGPNAAGGQDLVIQGRDVFSQNCSGCHYADKTEKKIGPGLKGLFQSEKLPVSGQAVTEKNVRHQIRSPLGRMPSFSTLPEASMKALIAYLKTI